MCVRVCECASVRVCRANQEADARTRACVRANLTLKGVVCACECASVRVCVCVVRLRNVATARVFRCGSRA